MTKSLSRQIRRARARQLAEKIIETYGGDTLPTVEQLYTLIGAKDGVIYDLQLNLAGLVQEKQRIEAELADIQEKLTQYETAAAEAVKDLARTVEVSLSPEQKAAVERLKAGVPLPEDEEEGSFGGTFRPS